MKAITIIFLMLFTVICLNAQIALHYNFNATTSNWIPIIGTQIPEVLFDDALSNPIPIGFTFPYGANSYTDVMVSSNGWVGLGSEFTSSWLGNNLPNAQLQPVIAPLWDDLGMQSGDCTYVSSGTAPNRIFVVQYVNAKWNYYANNQFSFQVKLYESGKISIHYGPRSGTPSNPSASIGINMAPGGQYWFYSVTPGSPATASFETENNTITEFPALNTVYEFNPAPPLNNDLTALSITGNNSLQVGVPAEFTVSVKNTGVYSQAIYQVKLITAANVELASVVGQSIMPGQTIDYNLSFTPATAGSLVIRGKVVMPGDEFPYNDTTPLLPLTILPANLGSVTIGDGDMTHYMPVNMYYMNSLWEGLYFPAELGFNDKPIVGVIFYNNFDTDLLNMPTKVWLGATSVNTLENAWIPSTSLVQVFDGTVSYPIGENTVFIIFDTPFHYFGGVLAMMVNRPMDTQYYSYLNTFYCQTVGENRSLLAAADYIEFNPALPPVIGESNLSGTFPKTTFLYQLPISNDDNSNVPLVTGLHSVYPNPFNPKTNISFSVQEKGTASVNIYNLKGQKVKTLLGSTVAAGQHSVVWDGTDDNGRAMASGVYFCRMEAGSHRSSLKMILMK